MYFMNLKVLSKVLTAWQCSCITSFICVIAIYIKWEQEINYYQVRIHVSNCCVSVYIAVSRGTRAEKVDHYCSNCCISKTTFSSSSPFFAEHTVPIFMTPTLAVLGVKGELVKAESQIILLSELTLLHVANFQRSHFSWNLAI